MHSSSFSIREEKRTRSGQSGMTLVEAMIAIAVLAVGAFSALTTLMSSTALDDELKERSLALRAAMTKMESVVAYDYNDDIDNLVNFWSLAANSTFAVDGLAPPNANTPSGSIAFNLADPERIVVTVTINWLTRKGETRTLSLPHTMTEVVD